MESIMKDIFIIIKQIGDLKEILPDGYADYNTARDIAKKIQDEIHNRGYIDFKVYSQPINIIGGSDLI
jgi:hypothetical protein